MDIQEKLEFPSRYTCIIYVSINTSYVWLIFLWEFIQLRTTKVFMFESQSLTLSYNIIYMLIGRAFATIFFAFPSNTVCFTNNRDRSDPVRHGSLYSSSDCDLVCKKKTKAHKFLWNKIFLQDLTSQTGQTRNHYNSTVAMAKEELEKICLVCIQWQWIV